MRGSVFVTWEVEVGLLAMAQLERGLVCPRCHSPQLGPRDVIIVLRCGPVNMLRDKSEKTPTRSMLVAPKFSRRQSCPVVEVALSSFQSQPSKSDGNAQTSSTYPRQASGRSILARAKTANRTRTSTSEVWRGVEQSNRSECRPPTAPTRRPLSCATQAPLRSALGTLSSASS